MAMKIELTEQNKALLASMKKSAESKRRDMEARKVKQAARLKHGSFKSLNQLRIANLKLLRNVIFTATQDAYAKAMKISQTELSRIETGKENMSDLASSNLEESYKLPSGWMDRNNLELFLNDAEFDLVVEIHDLPKNKQVEVVDLCNQIVSLLGKAK